MSNHTSYEQWRYIAATLSRPVKEVLLETGYTDCNLYYKRSHLMTAYRNGISLTNRNHKMTNKDAEVFALIPRDFNWAQAKKQGEGDCDALPYNAVMSRFINGKAASPKWSKCLIKSTRLCS